MLYLIYSDSVSFVLKKYEIMIFSTKRKLNNDILDFITIRNLEFVSKIQTVVNTKLYFCNMN